MYIMVQFVLEKDTSSSDIRWTYPMGRHNLTLNGNGEVFIFPTYNNSEIIAINNQIVVHHPQKIPENVSEVKIEWTPDRETGTIAVNILSTAGGSNRRSTASWKLTAKKVRMPDGSVRALYRGASGELRVRRMVKGKGKGGAVHATYVRPPR